MIHGEQPLGAPVAGKRAFSPSDIIMVGRKGLGNDYRSTGKGTRRDETCRRSCVCVCLRLSP